MMIRIGCGTICLLLLLSCSKPAAPHLRFRINNALHHFNTVKRSFGERECMGRLYEIAAEHGDRFFKINLAAGDTLKPGTYFMDQQPVITEAGKASFWYSSQGYSYTAKPFVITVHSYHNHRLVATFSGGAITEGSIDLMLEEK